MTIQEIFSSIHPALTRLGFIPEFTAQEFDERMLRDPVRVVYLSREEDSSVGYVHLAGATEMDQVTVNIRQDTCPDAEAVKTKLEELGVTVYIGRGYSTAW